MPSLYELEAWDAIQAHRPPSMARAVQGASNAVASGALRAASAGRALVERSPRASAALDRAGMAVRAVGAGAGNAARRAGEAVPVAASEWLKSTFDGAQRLVSRAARVGLTPELIVARHQAKGHAVERLGDVRRLDLEHVDAVRGTGLSWMYPAAAAVEGAGASFVVTGGQIAVGTGAAAAPGAGIVAGAFAADLASVTALSTRCVGHVGLYYGYDPDRPEEKLFALAVVNAGTAASMGAKAAAMRDLSRLTQALARRKAWTELLESTVAQVASAFAKAFGVRLTKRGLSKAVPVAGILLGGALNWGTLEQIVDAADLAYRRRFLLEKYPHLAGKGDAIIVDPDAVGGAVVDGDRDIEISVLDELSAEGGPQVVDPR